MGYTVSGWCIPDNDYDFDNKLVVCIFLFCLERDFMHNGVEVSSFHTLHIIQRTEAARIRLLFLSPHDVNSCLFLTLYSGIWSTTKRWDQIVQALDIIPSFFFFWVTIDHSWSQWLLCPWTLMTENGITPSIMCSYSIREKLRRQNCDYSGDIVVLKFTIIIFCFSYDHHIYLGMIMK